MNVKLIQCIFGAALVQLVLGCTGSNDRPAALGPETEKVRLVIYFSDGDWDGKSVGNWALINTGETLQIKRRSIRPDPKLVTSDWTTKFRPASEGQPQPGSAEMRLDRKQGVLCLGDECGFLYAICPSHLELSKGMKCQVFDVR